jgi:hypothetical protein
MVLSAEERAEVSRTNGRKGKGPVSAAGKRRARMSSLRHGMRAEALILPTENAAALGARHDEYLEWYQPQSPAAYYYLDMMITAERLKDRCEAAHDAALASNSDDVNGAFEQARSEMVAAQAALLETQPPEGVAALKRSSEGCAYLAQGLSEAAAMLASDGSWPLEVAAQVVHHFGAFSDPERIGGNETGYRLFVYNLHCRPHDPAALQALAHLSAPARRPAVLRAVDLGRWIPSPEVCRQWLQELLTAEAASLRLLGEALKNGKDGAGHHRVMTMARMLPEGDLSRQYLRYRKEADSRYIRGHRALLAELERDAEPADCEDQEDSDGGAAASPTVTTEPSAPPAAGTTGKVDSPNEPGNGRIATTIPPAGGNALFVLLLAFLLGGLLGGLGWVKDRVAALASEQPRGTSPALVEPLVGWASPTILPGNWWAMPALQGLSDRTFAERRATRNLRGAKGDYGLRPGPSGARRPEPRRWASASRRAARGSPCRPWDRRGRTTA